MPEEFLDLSEAPSSSYDLGGSRMAKPVRVHAREASEAGMLVNDFGNTRTIQCFEGWQGTNEHAAFAGF